MAKSRNEIYAARDRNHTFRRSLTLSIYTDEDIIEKLDSIRNQGGSIQDYIRQALLNQIEKEGETNV